MLRWRSHGTGTANQPPPLEDYNLFRRRRGPGRGAQAGGRRALGGTGGGVRGRSRRRAARVGPARERAPAEAPDARPLRRANRRDRVPSGLGLPAPARSRGTGAVAPVGRRAARCARRAGGALHVAGAGRGRRRLPALDDVRRRAGAAGTARSRRGVDPAPDERRRALRHGDDRTPGRLRRPRERDDRAPRRRRLVPRRPQVVLLGAHVGCLPRARAGARRALLLPRRAPAGGLPDRAAEGQARQPLQRLGGDRPRRRRSPARRRRGPRPPHDPRDGQPHAARLRARLDGSDAPRRRRGDAPRGTSIRLRPLARRAAADAERARRPLRRVGGCDGHGAPPRARLRRGGRPVPAPRDRRRQVLDLQANAAARRRSAGVPGRQRLRRGVAAAAPLPREPAQLDLGRDPAT